MLHHDVPQEMEYDIRWAGGGGEREKANKTHMYIHTNIFVSVFQRPEAEGRGTQAAADGRCRRG